MQQANLVELQAIVDSTFAEVDATQRMVANISAQIARIEEDKVRVREHDNPPTQKQQAETVQHAQDCLSRTVVALLDFRGQPLQVQGLLQQFVACIDSMRAAELATDSKQHTLEQSCPRSRDYL